MRALALLPILLVACAPAPETLMGGSSGSGGSDDPEDMSSGTGDPRCLGPPDEVEVEVNYQGINAIGYRMPVEVDRMCVVRAVHHYGEGVGAIALDCGGSVHLNGDTSLEVRIDRPLRGAPVAVETTVRLRVSIPGGGSSTSYIALHDGDGELVLAFASGPGVPGDGDGFPPADFFAPLTVASTWSCPFVCPTQGEAFLIRDCVCARRGTLEFVHGSDRVGVDDAATGTLAGQRRFDVRVTRAEAIDRDRCEALRPEDSAVDLRFLVVRAP